MSEDILTIRDAEYLKVTGKTVYGLAQKRKIPGFKVGGQWRFKREDIDFSRIFTASRWRSIEDE